MYSYVSLRLFVNKIILFDFLESEQGVFYHVKELWDSNIENIYGRQFVEYSIDKAIGKYIIFLVREYFISFHKFFSICHV